MDKNIVKALLLITSGYEKEYLIKHNDIIPYYYPVPICKESEREGIYKRALDEGKAWQEITGYKDPDDSIIL